MPLSYIFVMTLGGAVYFWYGALVENNITRWMCMRLVLVRCAFCTHVPSTAIRAAHLARARLRLRVLPPGQDLDKVPELALHGISVALVDSKPRELLQLPLSALPFSLTLLLHPLLLLLKQRLRPTPPSPASSH